jgi:agmatine deiminase
MTIRSIRRGVLGKMLPIAVFIMGSFLVPVHAQETNPLPKKLTHWLTVEEMTRLDEIGKSFVETDPPIAPVRNVAEFDYMQGVLVRYPFGIPMELIREMAEDAGVTTVVSSVGQQNSVLNQYVANNVDTSHCDFLIAGSDSYWTRDYGPWFVSDSASQIGIVDFPYNRPRPQDDEIPKELAEMMGIPWYGMNVIHTGGNYMTDGYGNSASTTLVYEENPTLSALQIDERMFDYLGIENYHVVEDPNGTYIDHIDCWAKFLAPNKILVREVPPTHPRYNQIEQAAAYWETQTCAFGYDYEVYRVNTPNDQPYTNSLILNNKVLVPIMNSSWDDSALARYEQAMPGYEIIGIVGKPSTPWESTDALHCRTKGIADTGQLFVHHLPLFGNRPCELPGEINAHLIVCSGAEVVEDSVLIHYRVNGGDWEIVTMEATNGTNYSGAIPPQPGDNLVEYFITAADQSGRHANAPFIGEPDPYPYNTIYTMLTPVPDTLFFNNYDECMEGKVTVLNNFTDGKITITNIPGEGFGTGFGWYINTLPTTPILMDSGDTVELCVRITFPLLEQFSGYAIDTLMIETSGGEVPVIIAVNESLITSIDSPDQIAEAYLGSAYPNPFIGNTTIPFTLPKEDHVTLQVYDITGNLVATLIDGRMAAGIHQINWNGNHSNGQQARGGVYIYNLKTSDQVLSKRMVLLK